MLNSPKQKTITLAIASGILLAATYRLIPHAGNFAPIGALALFSGAMLTNKRMAVVLPLAAMLMSDALLELFKPGIGFYLGMGFNYFAFALIALLGIMLNKDGKINPMRAMGGSLAGTTIFFLVSNFSTWYGMPGFYSPTFSGLLDCYTMGLPFIRPTLLSDFAFNTLFFGSYFVIAKAAEKRLVKTN
jgi:hypothetical protein